MLAGLQQGRQLAPIEPQPTAPWADVHHQPGVPGAVDTHQQSSVTRTCALLLVTPGVGPAAGQRLEFGRFGLQEGGEFGLVEPDAVARRALVHLDSADPGGHQFPGVALRTSHALHGNCSNGKVQSRTGPNAAVGGLVDADVLENGLDHCPGLRDSGRLWQDWRHMNTLDSPPRTGFVGGLLLALALPVIAAEPPVASGWLQRDFIVRRWRQENGLPDNRVLSLLCDRQGFLWVGTRRGVSRFDGERFVTWSRSTDAAFVDEQCHALAQDLHGHIWVGTGAGLMEIGEEVRHHSLADVPTPEQLSGSGENVEVGRVLCLPDGRMAAGSNLGLFVRSTGKGWQAQWGMEPGRMVRGMIPAAMEDQEGRLWAATGAQLFVESPVDGTWQPQFPEPLAHTTHHVFDLAETRDGTRYALVGDYLSTTARLWRLGEGGWVPVSDEIIRNFSNPPWLFADSQGALWYPMERFTRQMGGNMTLVRRRRQDITLYPLDGFANTTVLLCMAEDHEGNLWIGTSEGGLACLEPRRFQTLTHADGLPDDNTWAVIETADGSLWVGTDGGVARFHGDRVETLTEADGLSRKEVKALAEDAQGRVWIGTAGGITIWDHGALTWRNFDGEWFRTKIRTLYAARDGSMWVGAARGLHRVKDGEVTTWLPKDGLPHENVLAILEDRQGTLWFGTGGGGLARWVDGRFETLGRKEGLESLHVWSLFEDADGLLWAGTDHGLHCVRDGRATALTTGNGLPVNEVNSVLGDGLGSLWVGHDHGIYRAPRQALLEVVTGRTGQVHCVSYGEADGLLNVENNGQISQPPSIRLRDGRLAFATVAGLALVDPAHRPDLTNAPLPRVERLQVSGVTRYQAPPGGGSGVRGMVPAHLEPVRVPPEAGRSAEFTFTAPSFRGVEQTRFRYRLIGLQPEWVEAGTERRATYAYLPPGDYTFEVIAINRHGYRSSHSAMLPVQIESRWYERTSVRLLGVGTLLGLAALGVGWRIRELRHLHQLEEEAARFQERSRLARDLHDGLGANLTELTLLSRVGETRSIPPEEMARRLDRLSETTHDALHALRELIWVTNPKADSLEALAARVCQQAERRLRSARLRCRLELPDDLPQVPVPAEMRRELVLATNEIVHNAVRHAAATVVHLRLRIESGVLVIEIEDDGRGFDPADPVRPGTDGSHGVGLGSVKDRMTAIRGTCEIRSQPGQGTCVILRLPLNGT